jgi:predicted  nucleic acid-binding Zn-ribbon protein
MSEIEDLEKKIESMEAYLDELMVRIERAERLVGAVEELQNEVAKIRGAPVGMLFDFWGSKK